MCGPLTVFVSALVQVSFQTLVVFTSLFHLKGVIVLQVPQLRFQVHQLRQSNKRPKQPPQRDEWLHRGTQEWRILQLKCERNVVTHGKNMQCFLFWGWSIVLEFHTLFIVLGAVKVSITLTRVKMVSCCMLSQMSFQNVHWHYMELPFFFWHINCLYSNLAWTKTYLSTRVSS